MIVIVWPSGRTFPKVGKRTHGHSDCFFGAKNWQLLFCSGSIRPRTKISKTNKIFFKKMLHNSGLLFVAGLLLLLLLLHLVVASPVALFLTHIFLTLCNVYVLSLHKDNEDNHHQRALSTLSPCTRYGSWSPRWPSGCAARSRGGGCRPAGCRDEKRHCGGPCKECSAIDH